MKTKEELIEMCWSVARFITLSMVEFDKKVWKGYFGIETPLYKIWWNIHKEAMESKLRQERSRREIALTNGRSFYGMLPC